MKSSPDPIVKPSRFRRQDNGWCVVVSAPASEFVAEKAALRSGFRVYCPKYRRISQPQRFSGVPGAIHPMRGRREIVSSPLFTGYLFAELHTGQQWRPLLTATGIDSVLVYAGGETPALLPDELIEEMRGAEHDGLFDDPRLRPKIARTKAERLKAYGGIGAELRIQAGAFAGFIGKLADADDNDRLTILLDILGRATPVHLEGHEVETIAGVA